FKRRIGNRIFRRNLLLLFTENLRQAVKRSFINDPGTETLKIPGIAHVLYTKICGAREEIHDHAFIHIPGNIPLYFGFSGCGITLVSTSNRNTKSPVESPSGTEVYGKHTFEPVRSTAEFRPGNIVHSDGNRAARQQRSQNA